MVVICALLDLYALLNELNFIFHFLFVPESYFETINIKWFLFSVLLEEDLHVHEHVHVYIRTSKRSLKGTYVDAQFTFFFCTQINDYSKIF